MATPMSLIGRVTPTAIALVLIFFEDGVSFADSIYDQAQPMFDALYGVRSGITEVSESRGRNKCRTTPPRKSSGRLEFGRASCIHLRADKAAEV
jgi:hypothetical protein